MTTTRDKIWASVLDEIEYSRSFSAYDIQEKMDDSPATRTIRDTLDSMESLGFLSSTGGTGRAPRMFSPCQPASNIEPPGYTPRQTSQSTIIPWPGAKGQLSQWIIDHIPDHDTYIELFGGSAAVLINKPKSKYEIYNDSNQDLTQFFKVLRDKPEDLATWLQDVPYSRSQYEDWVSDFYEFGIRPDDPVERAGRFFSLRYMQYIGIASEANGFKTRAKRSPARTFNNAKRRLRTLAQRFDDVTIECRDFQDILDAYDDTSVDVVIYADPPYAGSEEHYGGDFEQHRLIEGLREVDSDWMLSCLQLPDEIDRNNYTVIERTSRHRMSRGDGQVTEKLVCNFQPNQRRLFVDVINPE